MLLEGYIQQPGNINLNCQSLQIQWASTIFLCNRHKVPVSEKLAFIAGEPTAHR